jgi:hypothetical protein
VAAEPSEEKETLRIFSAAHLASFNGLKKEAAVYRLGGLFLVFQQIFIADDLKG